MEQKLKYMKQINIKAFQNDLIGWYNKEKRDLPWRKDKDPYKIWVSEIMLQQTRVDTVIPYYNRFLQWFPSINDLANAEEDKVLKAWEGLGYYSRVRNLQSAVREVREKYNGVVPNTADEISSLKGVGPYTAGAILSIAYGIPEPAVDGNVMRVLSRILSIWEDIAKPATRKVFEEAARQLISSEDPSSFNQALMELGALVCTPTLPSCLLCPVRSHCQAYHEGIENELPVKSKKTKQRVIQLAAIVLNDKNKRILIHKRPNQGLLANMWEYPNVEIHLPMQNEKRLLADLFLKDFNLMIEPEKRIGQIEHVFSHLIWNINIYTGRLVAEQPIQNNWKLVTIDKMEELAFPVSHQKITKLYSNTLNHKMS